VPDKSVLDSARSEVSAATSAQAQLLAAGDRRAEIALSRDEAAATTTTAQARLEAAQQAVEEATLGSSAAYLRPHLEVGHECPVCAHLVETLPPPLDSPQIEMAKTALSDARSQLDEARMRFTHATEALLRHDTETTLTARQIVDCCTRAMRLLQDALPGLPDFELTSDAAAREAVLAADLAAVLADIDARETTRQALAKQLSEAERGVSDAKTALARAASEGDTATHTVADARSQLSHHAGALADLDPPKVEKLAATDLGAAWAQLTQWANAQLEAVTAAVAAKELELTDAQTAAADAQENKEQAEAQAQQAQTDHAQAARASTQAAADLSNITDQLTGIDAELADAPPAEEIPNLLAEAARLADAVTEARAGLGLARTVDEKAKTDNDHARAAATDAWRHLNTIRDHVAVLSPPTLSANDLVAAWETLTKWATATDSALAKEAAEAATTLADARDQQTQMTESLKALAAAAIESDTTSEQEEESWKPDEASPDEIVREIAVRAERAHGHLKSVRSRRKQSAAIRAKIETASERAKVASTLALLMRSNRFPQWLADSALDTLVSGASDALRSLSGDRFDLTHDRGDFFVIDHHDADSTRSVRTLSGGETFQASLALALTLSDQLAGMAATTKLESIVLDEGFGTLDPDSLETVAATLENLAQGERTVGVITHVAALADRAPVRFQVATGIRTATITREGM
jgi:DNA repair protein SbcC/Rad50